MPFGQKNAAASGTFGVYQENTDAKGLLRAVYNEVYHL